jgi:hypothetical protein
MLFESFLANNVKFGSLNEIINFIYNVTTEPRTYNDDMILDENITLEEAYYKVMTTCGFDNYVPNEKEMMIVWEIMMRLRQEDLNRLYYKNNLYSFCDNRTITNAVTYILQKLEEPFLNPNEPPETVKVELDELLGLFREYVYYGYQIIDKMDRVEMMIRDVVLITDTDSCIVSLDAWYRYTLDKVYNVPMEIKCQRSNPFVKVKGTDEFGEPILRPLITKVEPCYDYDFYSDELIEVQKLREPFKVYPQEGLRYSIINIMAYCVGKLILDYMEKYTMNYNSYSINRKCLLIMKNEFLFKRILLTDGKKNYASIQEMQEGNIVPKEESLNITGLNMDKSGLQMNTRKKLKKVLFDDVLNSPEIDQLQVLKDIIKIEKDIYNSLVEGKKEYYKPLTVKSMSNYDNPMRIQGIKASIVYNALRDDHTEAIDLEKRNSVTIVKVNIDHKSLDNIKEKYPEKYGKIIELMKIKEFASGIDTIAIPLNVDVPDWIIEFIDFNTIISDNIKNFPLDSIGLYRMNQVNINYTNILKI